MRRSFLGALGALFFFTAPASAFPNPPTSADPFWIPILRSTAVIQDAVSAAANSTDIVGDPSHPAAYLASDATNLYLRVRVNGAPSAGGVGCMIDTDGTLTTYEYLAIYDFNGLKIRYLQNTTAGTADTSNNTAETSISSVAVTASNGVVSTADSTFSSNADSFVDIAIPWATVHQGGVSSATALRFVCGTTTTATADDLATDIYDGAASLTLSSSWSDAYTCNSGGNLRCTTGADSDGDGVSDALETSFGTNKNSIDTDGDGIPDYFELTLGSNPTLQAVNTDGDGKIDALDTDSDNDCVPDVSDGLANYRNASLPNANASVACSGTTPICNKTTGVCSACNGSLASGQSLTCYSAAKPYCAPDGACGECTPSQTSACTSSAAPACESTTDACSACNGDRNSGASASCPSAATPACNLSGALVGTCTQCTPSATALCGGPNPACTDIGSCGPCTVDNGVAGGAACPSAASPACNTAGPFTGRCTTCSASNTSLCPTDKPTCDPSSAACAACTSDHDSGGALACPNASAPTCSLSGANKGQCGKCVTSADCGTGHTGPTCDPVSGACLDVDSDGDGIQDEVEVVLGTDPHKVDTDGDGIDDKTEVTPQGGGSFSKVDTDNDGTIDALDTDSDADGLLDADEARAGDAGPILDTDGDKIPNYRDPDDDNDGIDTKVEIADTKAAGVSDDVDGDHKVNWLDSDANDNGKLDGVDGRGDDDNDGIPNYLDRFKDVPLPEAGPPVEDAGSSSSSSSSSSTSSGFVSTPLPPENSDAGAPPTIAPDEGVLEGSGCSTTGGAFSSFAAFGLAALGITLARRRRR